MRVRRSLAPLCGVAALVAAAWPASAQEEVDFRVVLSDEPFSLDACTTGDNVNGRVTLNNVFEGLTYLIPGEGDLNPWLATSWEPVDEETWRFELREGVTFHDGSEMTAEDVKYSLDRLLNPNLPCDQIRAKFFAGVTAEAEVIDDYTIEITTSQPDPILPTKMSTVMIHPSTVPFDEITDEPIGTGAYQLAEWVPGQYVRLERWEDYWGEAPSIETAEFVWRSESSVRAAMVQQGEADIAPSVAMQDVTADLGTSYLNSETSRLNLDLEKAPMDDIRVREAMNLAIDREAMLGTVVSPEAIPATQLIIPEIPGHSEDVPLWGHDPERARALIEEARADGVPVDDPIQFVGRIGHFPNATEFHEVIAIMLNEAGLNVQLQWFEAAQKNQMQVKPFDPDRMPQIIVDQHDNNTGDPVFTTPGRWHSEGVQSKLDDPEVDRLIDLASTSTGEERTEAWERAHEAIAELVPNVMLFHMVAYAAIADHVNYEPTMATNSSVRLGDVTLD